MILHGFAWRSSKKYAFEKNKENTKNTKTKQYVNRSPLEVPLRGLAPCLKLQSENIHLDHCIEETEVWIYCQGAQAETKDPIEVKVVERLLTCVSPAPPALMQQLLWAHMGLIWGP